MNHSYNDEYKCQYGCYNHTCNHDLVEGILYVLRALVVACFAIKKEVFLFLSKLY